MESKETYVKKVREIGNATSVFMTEALRIIGADVGSHMVVEVLENDTIVLSKFKNNNHDE